MISNVQCELVTDGTLGVGEGFSGSESPARADFLCPALWCLISEFQNLGQWASE